MAKWPLLGAGRGPAGRRVLDWAVSGGGAPLVVSGSAGSGKSHLLAWWVTGGQHDPATTVHGLAPARGLTADAVAWELGRQLGYGPLSPGGLLERIRTDRRPLTLGFADLHRARPGCHEALVEPLLGFPHVRLLLETAGTGYVPDGAVVVDLDDPTFTDQAEFAAWYGEQAPAAPAFTANQVFPHPAAARLAATIPGPPARGDVAAVWWERLPEAARPALQTLAALRGPVPADVWELVHARLTGDPAPGEAVGAAVARLPRGTVHEVPPGGPLVEGADARIVDILKSEALTSAYARDHVLGHALAAGTAERLLRDAGFLVHGSAAAVAAALADPDTARAAPAVLAPLWRRAAPVLSAPGMSDPERAALLHCVALADAPPMAALLRPVAERHAWTAVWFDPGRSFTALGPGTGSSTGTVEGALLAADAIGRVHALDPATGAELHRVPSPAAVRPFALAALGDGLLLLDREQVLHLSPADTPAFGEAAYLHNPQGPSALAALPATGHLAVGDTAGRVHLWRSPAYDPEPLSRPLHNAPVSAVAVVRSARHDLTFCLSGGLDGTLRLWAAPDEPMQAPVERRDRVITALAAADTPSHGPVAVAAWSDGRASVWNLLDARVRPVPLPHRADALGLRPDGLLTATGPGGTYALGLHLDRLWA
ncbi:MULTISPECIES: hypothetical protein [unclassified Streptomyces]|uniref:hypothetical protein n=1 Tax=unclassified Streptomyces TaxID=2593676 RepID=UPI0037F90B74